MAELQDFNVMEVSLVPKAANRRKFLLLKTDEHGGSTMADVGEVMDAICKDMGLEEEAAAEGDVYAWLSSADLSDDEKKSIAASLSILKEYVDSVPDEVLAAMFKADRELEGETGGGDTGRELEGQTGGGDTGRELEGARDNPGQYDDKGEDNPENPEHLEKLQAVADSVGEIRGFLDTATGRFGPYVEGLENPASEVQDALDDMGEVRRRVDEVAGLLGATIRDYRDETNPNQEEDKDMIAKSDLEGLPEDVKATVQALWKEHEEALKKSQELEDTLQKERDERLQKEFIDKAEKEFQHLPVKSDEFGLLLKSMAAKLDADEYKAMTELLGSVERTIEEGEILKERGSDGTLPAGGVMGKIEAMAKELVQKSDGKLTKEQAVSRVLSMDTKLYDEYINEASK